MRGESLFIDAALLDQFDVVPFYQAAKAMRARRAERQESMSEDQNEAADQRRQDRRGTIDRAREHRGEDEGQNCVISGLLREKPLITHPDNPNSHGEDDQPAEADL